MVLSIYLDQNMWIGLKEAVAGRPGGRRFVGLLDACQRAVDESRCKFVLSYSHYEENFRRPQLVDREEMANVMFSLSRCQTISLPQVIVRHEIRAALVEVLDLASSARLEYTPFGMGADHALDFPLIANALASIAIPAGCREVATEILEWRALVGAEADHRDLPSDYPKLSRTNNERYIAHRANLADRMKSWSRDRDRADRFNKAAELIELLWIIEEVAVSLGASSDDLFSLGQQGIDRFLSLLPMHSIVAFLRRASLLADRAWQLNDHNDVVYLSSAAAYCDAVAGERHWTAKLKEPRCPTRSSLVLSSPEELQELMSN